MITTNPAKIKTNLSVLPILLTTSLLDSKITVKFERIVVDKCNLLTEV